MEMECVYPEDFKSDGKGIAHEKLKNEVCGVMVLWWIGEGNMKWKVER